MKKALLLLAMVCLPLFVSAQTKEKQYYIYNIVTFSGSLKNEGFKNVTLKSDYNGNVKPNKAIGKKKIDGVIAMIQALGMYLDTPHFTNEILTI